MKVGIFFRDPYSEDGFVYPDVEICTSLTLFGNEVHWIVASRESNAHFRRGDVEVHSLRYPFASTTKNILLKTARLPIYELSRLRLLHTLFRKQRYDALIVKENPFDGLVATWLKRTQKTRFVLMLPNPLDQEWEGYKISHVRPLILYYLIASFNRFILRCLVRRADLVVTSSRAAGADLLRFGVSPDRVFAVPAGISPQRFRDNATSGIDVLGRYALGGRVVIYVGSVAKARRLDVMIHAFALLAGSYSDSKLLIVGDGNAVEDLKRLSRELGLGDRIVFTGVVSQRDVPTYIQAADVAVCPVPPYSFYRMSSPIKLYEYMAMGKPVVANVEITEHREVLEESGGGILVSHGPQGFAAGIRTLLEDTSGAAEMGERGRTWVLKNRTYELLADRLNKRLQPLFTGNM
jgi:glycosyltransferase involved in cell wall biosynthesis